MHIAIVGAGIIGVSTAYELAADGHQVTVFERHASVAEGASFANAGVLAPGYVTPWAAPGMPAKVIGHLLARYAPVRVTRPLAMADLGWMRRWLRACDAGHYAAHRAQLQRLAFYSRQRLHEVAARMQYDFERSQGYLVLLRGEQEQRIVQPGLAVLREAGVVFHEIDGEQARRIEPALKPDTPLAGAIHLPQDEVGNCRQFAVILRDAAQTLGARFCFDTAVHARRRRPDHAAVGRRQRALRRRGAVRRRAVGGLADAAGPARAAAAGVRLLGQRAHARPGARPAQRRDGRALQGRHLAPGPARARGRLGPDRRAARRHQRARRADALQGAGRLVPGAARRSGSVQVWKGARPMLPDGPPLIGASGVPGLWLNLGHGSSGWALSCGSARLLADQVAGREPAIDAAGYGIDRYR
jgi:D-amino-acid dehydrogenase